MTDQENESIEQLNEEIETLKACKERLEIEIFGDKKLSDDEKKDLLEDLFEKVYKKNEEKKIIEKVGLKKYREFCEAKSDELFDLISFTEDDLIELTKKWGIANDLYTLINRSTYDKKWYYLFMILVIGALGFSSWYAYEYGAQIIVEIHGMKERTSSDYFGFFLMKMPFSLIIIAFISGAFIFINKLLFIIERINNQLRNFSKISVIASQMDNTYIDLIKNGNFSNKSEAEQNAHKEAEQKDLFYKLITNYLVSLSKNEADLADSKKEPLLKQVKQIAGIVKEFNSFNKDK